MKRIVIVFFGLALIFASAGCKNAASDTPADPETGIQITVNVLAYGNDSNYEGTNFARIAKEFEAANPSIKLNYELHYGDDYHSTVAKKIAAKDFPDVAYMGADTRWGKPWADAGQQYDLKPLLDSSVYDFNLIPSMGSAGEYYELPLGTANLASVLFMNIQALKDCGLDANVPASYDSLKAMAAAAKAKGCEVLATHGKDEWALGTCFLSCFVGRTSGDPQWVRKAKEGTEKFTDAEFVDALSILETMKNDGVLTASSLDYDADTLFAKYNDGKILFMVTGQWDAGNISATAQANTKIIAFPAMPGEKSACAASVAGAVQVGYGITAKGAKDEKVRDAALKFLNFYNSSKEVTDRLRNGMIVAPVLKNYTAPADLSQYMKLKMEIGKKTTVITDILDAYISGGMDNAINTSCASILKGTLTPAAAAAAIENAR